ncbi:MAG: histidine kinase [Crocinitomicaceae bacterium]|nr:histidine kinase [Crocinitomicaceae bacterium]
MERKVLFYWLAQIIGWGAYYGLSVFLLMQSQDFRFTANLVYYVGSSMLFSILVSHLIRFGILKLDLLNKGMTALILLTILLSISAAFSLEFFQYFITAGWIEVDFFVEKGGSVAASDSGFGWAEFLLGTTRSAILFLLWSGLYFAFIFIAKARQQEIQNLKWNVSRNEIELKNLRAQLNPHFLFNSLNSIRALVGLDPEQAKTAITRLSTLLRHSINLEKQKVIHLKDELDLVKNYLELEKIRFEERLQIKYEIADNSLACEIPPLMVQTIVENCIKHGISKSIEGGLIRIKTEFNQPTLSVTISNHGKLDSSKAENGIGIANTKKRLEILYGENANFSIEQVGSDVVARINITYI